MLMRSMGQVAPCNSIIQIYRSNKMWPFFRRSFSLHCQPFTVTTVDKLVLRQILALDMSYIM